MIDLLQLQIHHSVTSYKKPVNGDDRLINNHRRSLVSCKTSLSGGFE